MTRAVVFAYSEVGVRCVRELLAQGVKIPLLFTHDDDPGESQWFGSVRQLAEAHGIRTERPDSPNTPQWIAEGRAAEPDFLFSFYYRHMLDRAWLTVPRRGALNMTARCCPSTAAGHRCIGPFSGRIGDGASLHYMLEKPDAGALVDQQSVPILENDTALEVSLKVAAAAAEVLRRSLPRLIDGSAEARPLDLSAGSYFGRRRPEDGRIDWRCSARAVHDLVRAVAPPFPGAFTEVNGCRLAVLETRVDARPVRYYAHAPCLYAEDGEWFADCIDGRRLRILKLAMNGETLTPAGAPPALMKQPLALA